MNQELEAKLIDYLQKTESFVVSEAPEFIIQSINYYFYEHLLTLIVLLFLVFCTSLFLFNISKIYDYLKNKRYWCNSDADAVCFLGGIISLITLVCSSISIFINTLTLIKICIAPNLYLLERFTQ